MSILAVVVIVYTKDDRVGDSELLFNMEPEQNGTFLFHCLNFQSLFFPTNSIVNIVTGHVYMQTGTKSPHKPELCPILSPGINELMNHQLNH